MSCYECIILIDHGVGRILTQFIIKMATRMDSSRIRCEGIVNLICLLGVFTFLSIIYLLLLPWRTFAWIMAKLFRPDLVDFVYGLSAFLVNLDDFRKPIASVAGCYIIEGQISVEEFRALTLQRVLQLPDFERKYAALKQGFDTFLGYTFRKRLTDFRIEDHVKDFNMADVDLSHHNDIFLADLEVVITYLLSKPWDRDKSPWEFLLIRNYKEQPSDSSRKMLFCVRLHHSIADGHSLNRLFRDLFQAKIVLPQPGKSAPERLPLWKRLLVPVISLYHFAKLDVENQVEAHDWQLKEPQREYLVRLSKEISVGRIKEIKNFYQVSYMSVLLSAIGVAVTRVMKEAGQKVPSTLKFCVPGPKPHHPGGMNNHALLLVLLMDSETTISPALLRRITLRMKKKSLAPFGADALVTIIGRLPNGLFPFPKADVSFGASYFPVSEEPLYFQGLKVTGSLHAVGAFNASAMVAISGSSGCQRISFTIDKSIITSTEVFRNLSTYVDQELDKIYELMRRGKSGDIDQAISSCVVSVE